MADNLIQKNGESTWYVRLAVPVDVQQKLGCKVLVQSLKTGMRGEAMTRRLPILHEWKTLIAKARAGTPLPDGWQDSVAAVAQQLDTLRRDNKRALICEPVDALMQPDPGFADFVEKLRAAPHVGEPLIQLLLDAQDKGLSAQLQLADSIADALKRLIPERFAKHYDVTADQVAEMNQLAAYPNALKGRSPITPARIKAYRDFREGRPGSSKHIEQQVGKMERLSAFLKESCLSLSFDSVDLWLKSLNRAPKTLGQYTMAGSAYWEWALRYDAGWREAFKGQTNPFKNHVLPSGGGRDTAGEKRKAYTTKDLERLHKGALDAGNGPLADLILLGAYTGSRIEQLCQLRVEQVIDQDGIQSFDFIGGKNENAERVVPVHDAIKATVSRLISDSHDGYLIPTTTQNKHGKRSHALSKAFGLLRTKMGFGPLHVFHSMRNTVVTVLARANVPGPLIAELVGHDTGTVTFDVYARGASVTQKYDAIMKLPTLNI